MATIELAGGELRVVMQAKPNKTWARRRDERPFSMSGPAPVRAP